MIYLFGLGNPGKEYESTRHNTGRMAVAAFLKYLDKEPELSKKIKIIESGEFMNNSGKAVAKIIKSKKAAKDLVVVYDDIDLPLGTIKISYNKGSGGHKGVESIMKALKTREFARIRIGIAPTTPSGKIKKPEGENKVLDFILGEFKPKEVDILKKVFKKASEALSSIITSGLAIAMNQYN